MCVCVCVCVWCKFYGGIKPRHTRDVISELIYCICSSQKNKVYYWQNKMYCSSNIVKRDRNCVRSVFNNIAEKFCTLEYYVGLKSQTRGLFSNHVLFTPSFSGLVTCVWRVTLRQFRSSSATPSQLRQLSRCNKPLVIPAPLGPSCISAKTHS